MKRQRRWWKTEKLMKEKLFLFFVFMKQITFSQYPSGDSSTLNTFNQPDNWRFFPHNCDSRCDHYVYAWLQGTCLEGSFQSNRPVKQQTYTLSRIGYLLKNNIFFFFFKSRKEKRKKSYELILPNTPDIQHNTTAGTGQVHFHLSPSNCCLTVGLATLRKGFTPKIRTCFVLSYQIN